MEKSLKNQKADLRCFEKSIVAYNAAIRVGAHGLLRKACPRAAFCAVFTLFIEITRQIKAIMTVHLKRLYHRL